MYFMTPRHIFNKNKNTKIYIQMLMAALVSSQKKERKQMSIKHM